MGAEGRWIAGTNLYNFLLFRRDHHTAGIAEPELELKLGGGGFYIHNLAFTETGPYAAVITATVVPPFRYTLYLIGRCGVIWSSELPEGTCKYDDMEEAVLDISTDGRFVAVGGFGGNLRLYSTQSPNPLWTIPVVENCGDSWFSDLAISANGSSLAFVLDSFYGTFKDCVFFVHDTSQAPDLNDPENWRWPDGTSFSWSQPYPTPGISMATISYYMFEHVNISEDGQYVFASGQWSYRTPEPEDYWCIWGMTGISFHRDGNPLRLYGGGPCVSLEHSGAMSPDGSWVMMGGNESVARFEVTPVERIECNMPAQVELPLISWLFPLPPVQVDYTIYKAGRATNLRQNWELAFCNSLICSGDCDFQWDLAMPTGNIVTSGTREVDLPSCWLGGTLPVQPFVLSATLEDTSTQTPYWLDETIVVNITPF